MKSLLPTRLHLMKLLHGLVLVGSLIAAFLSPAHAAELETGLHYYAVVDLRRGEVVQRGKAGENGIAFDQLILGPRRAYRVFLLQASTFRIAEQSFVTPESGSTFTFGTFTLYPSRAGDSDHDGLPEDAELIMGTDPKNPDTDGDGVSDAEEVRSGADPLSGLAIRTGLIASVGTPGPAVDVCAVNNMALVAMMDRGVGIFNVFAGLAPVSITQVDTPGQAQRVTCSGSLVAVADGSAGLAVIDISDPPAAGVKRQVALNANAISVTAVGNLAFVGLDSGDLVVVDMTSGSLLSRRFLGAAVMDLVFGSDLLYALTKTDLVTLRLNGKDLDLLSTVSSPLSNNSFNNLRVLAGGGFLYATHNGGYNVFSLAEASRPSLVASHVSTSNGWRQLALTGSGDAVAAVGTVFFGDADLSVYDVRDPRADGRLITTLPTPGVARSVALFNGLAYCADDVRGLEVYNFLPPDRAQRPPTIRLETNFAGNRAEEGKLFAVGASVDDDVQVRSVEFYLDGRVVATIGSFPFEYRFIAPNIGEGRDSFTLRARATDTGGNASWTEETRIQLVPDATPPVVARLSPPNGALVRETSAISVTFSEVMSLPSLGTNLTLRAAGPDGAFFTADDLAYTNLTIQFQTDVLSASLQFDPPLGPGRYRLDVAAGVTDLAGNPIGTAQNSVFNIYDFGVDADGDCLPDSFEVAVGLNPNSPDSNTNGIKDGDEDADRDGFANCAELFVFHTDPFNADTDGNGVKDGDEDNDNDGLSDAEEVVSGKDAFVTNPFAADSDGDGLDDGVEVALGLNPNNPGDAQPDVVLDGRTLSLTGNARFKSLKLINGAVLTHPPYSGSGLVGLSLTVSNLTVDRTSRIDVSGKGYAGGLSRYNGAQTRGRTRGNVPGSFRRSGASYGGLAASGDTGEPVNDPYGDALAPLDLGSGGGSDSGEGGAGGGRIRITADQFSFEGLISANGADGSRYAGGGSGGAIFITATNLIGAGTMEARGGRGGDESSGGGGGRVAILAKSVSGSVLEHLTATGGGGFAASGPGTLYTQVGSTPSELLIRGGGRETPLGIGNPGGRITLDGASIAATTINASQLRLLNGAVLTHPAATLVSTAQLELEVDTLVVEAGSRIDVSGRGFSGGSRLDTDWRGRTLGNVFGSSRRSGGSYGGLGATGDVGNEVNSVYGDFRDPGEPGSGGGSDNGPGGSGGGVLRITARSLTVDGELVADGFNGSRYAGGGSGGAIFVQTTTLAGLGSVHANGGAGGDESGTGGGGRVAIRYAQSSGSLIASARALAGKVGFGKGGPGTVYLDQTGSTPVLIVRGEGRETPLPDGDFGIHVLLDGATTSATRLGIADLTLTNAAVLTHPAATPTAAPTLELTTRSLTLDAKSRIDVSGRGYPGGNRRGNGQWAGLTLGLANGSGRRAGGSHGGLGGSGDAEGVVAEIYGDYAQPNAPGAGGGSDSAEGGAGGGVLNLRTDTLNLAGDILANGADGNRYGGGGAGGSLRLIVGNLVGSGRIQAQGGTAGSQAGAGGGGRIALYYAASSGSALDNLSAISQLGAHSAGAPGTLYLQRTNAAGLVIIRGQGRETPAPVGNPTDRLLVDLARVSASRLRFAEVHLTNQAALTHPPASQAKVSRLEIEADSVEVEADSTIDLSGRGYLGGLAQSGMSQSGRTFGNLEGSIRRTGGSYGGLGGYGNVERLANDAYGAWNDPDEVGSGGGSDAGPGGSGGGLLRLKAGTLTLQGLIQADGGNGGRYGGGGSGGGIRLLLGSLRGAGAIRANGGTGGSESGSGGGGRIAVTYTNAATFDLAKVEARGGLAAFSQGTPGTVFVRGPVNALGDLRIDARATNSPGRATPVFTARGGFSSTLTASQLTDAAARFVPGTLVGLELNPNQAQSKTFTILANDATTITLDAADGDARTVAAAGDAYAVNWAVDRLVIRDGARVEFLDADRARVDRSGRMSAANLDLLGGAQLAHPATTLTNLFGLDLNVSGSVTVDATSSIDVSDLGYLGGLRVENAGSIAGRTLGQALGSTARNGGSYAGWGALGDLAASEPTVNPLYGDPRNPADLGSGGGSDAGPAGSGGGRLRLQSGELQLDGRILADGGAGSRYAGGGSGGSLLIRANTLRGGGAISAKGGPGGSQSGGGGGGRIAVLYGIASGTVTDHLEATGGVGLRTGGPGTVFTRRGDDPGRFSLRGPGRETPFPVTQSTEVVWVDGATLAAGDISLGELSLTNGAVLTHPYATADTEPRLSITVSNLVVDASSRIDVSARGYLGALSGGYPSTRGLTLGNVAGSPVRVGGSHGGLGGSGNRGGTPNPVYGDPATPDTLGSGGGSDSGPAGNGGGRMVISAQNANLAGNLLADGGTGTRYGGGGSGGSIRLTTKSLTGAGILRARGGDGGSESGGGGGGRISVRYTTTTLPAENATAPGAAAGVNGGQAGSVQFQPGS